MKEGAYQYVHTLKEMNDSYIYDLCRGRKWDEVRKFLDTDSNNKDKKLEVVRYRGGNGCTCLHHACCYKKPPDDIIKSLLDIGGKELVMITNSWKRTALHYACWKNASSSAFPVFYNCVY